MTPHFETRLQQAMARATAPPCPPKLASALKDSVFSGGGRVRPQLVSAVAAACGAPMSELASVAATAIELLHCASLVHDDLPMFDDADLRRGKPTMHRTYGEQIALLAGDALIVQAFAELASAAALSGTASRITAEIARAAGAPFGITAGQAWESEEEIDVAAYHRAKTASLFEAAVVSGALAAGAGGEPWRVLGQCIGEAYQLADDLADATGTEQQLGKPVGQDLANGAPSTVRELGVVGTVRALNTKLEQTRQAVPDCPGRLELLALLDRLETRLCPPSLLGHLHLSTGTAVKEAEPRRALASV